jgi:hypothetical protein
MGWGNPFTAAWDAATDVAKAGAEKVASGAQWVGQKSSEAAAYAKEKAQEAAAYAKSQAEKLRKASVQKARDLQRAAADKVFDRVGSTGEDVRKTSKAVTDKYQKAKKVFGAGDAGSPVKPCEDTSNDAMTNNDRDGWLMAPQGPGKPCATIKPGTGAAAKAREKSQKSESACCKKKRAAGIPPRDIIYVNGIQTDSKMHCDTLNAIAAQTCGRVIGVYNATAGLTMAGFVADALQTEQDRRLIKAADAGKPIPSVDGRNPAVDTLWKTTVEELRAGRKPEIWAHSQGGAVTRLAMHTVENQRRVATVDPNPLSGIKINSFGSAAQSWADGPTYEHYIHVNDFTPTYLGLGHDSVGDLANAGAGAKVIRFSGDPKSAIPFSEKPDLAWVPSATSNHGIDETYLKMEKQKNGGCP